MLPNLSSTPKPTIHIFQTKELAAKAAASEAACYIRDCITARGKARIMVGTGNSQMDLIAFLAQEGGVDWSRVEAFHLDEYVGLPATHPASFRLWIRTRFSEKVKIGIAHYIDGDAKDLGAMLANYSAALNKEPMDLAFVGIGENGHIAFNDPHVADFNDPLLIKRVTLDTACRQQQVGEGHFPNIESVPAEAISVSCTGLFRAKKWICCVPDLRKAVAVKGSLEGPVSTKCPGSLVQKHPSASLYLDPGSASLLTMSFVAARCTSHY